VTMRQVLVAGAGFTLMFTLFYFLGKELLQ
jgi:hypothetical protein